MHDPERFGLGDGDGTYRHDAPVPPVPTIPIADLPLYMQPRPDPTPGMTFETPLAPSPFDVRHPAFRPQMPSIGRIVRYRLHKAAVEDINTRLQAARHNFLGVQYRSDTCAGSDVDEGQEVAAIIVAVLSPGNPHSLVNLQLMLDGNFSHWVTHVGLGTEPGTWSWPERS